MWLVSFVLSLRSFKPDFVLIRQHGYEANHDWRNIIIGLYYGGVPSLNPLPSIYCFLDKPFVVSRLFFFFSRKLPLKKLFELVISMHAFLASTAHNPLSSDSQTCRLQRCVWQLRDCCVLKTRKPANLWVRPHFATTDERICRSLTQWWSSARRTQLDECYNWPECVFCFRTLCDIKYHPSSARQQRPGLHWLSL